MGNTKKWWQSKGVLGGILATVGSAVGIATKYQVTPDLVTVITNNLHLIVTGVAGLLAAWGRIKASKRISK